MKMALSSALFLPLLVCVSVVAFEFTLADEKACSIGRYGALTMFNGEMAEVKLPCKYRLAHITCGDYRVTVTPGWDNDQEHSYRFSPHFVWVEVINTETSSNVLMLTSVTRINKFFEGTVSNPWKKKAGSRSVVDVANYDQASAAAVLRKDGVFTVELSSAERSVLVTCSDQEFVSKGLPEALCGDGTTTNAMNNAITTLFPGQDDMTVDELISYVVLNNTQVDQIMTCTDMASKFTSCQDKERAAMECVDIFADLSLAECLAGSDTSLRNYYADCLTSVCDADSSAVEPMNNYIRDNCQQPWQETSCDSDADCPDGINAECFDGKCLCTPGYYYSNGQDVCVGDCPEADLQSEYLVYPGSYMSYLGSGVRVSLDECLSMCADDSKCRTVSFRVDYNECNPNPSTPLTDPSRFYAEYPWDDSTTYQKRCGSH